MRQPPPHPGEIFRTEIREQQAEPISQAEAARRLGYTPYHWGQIELGRRPFTAETCVKVEQLTGVSAEFWARLQMHHDLWHALQAAKRGELKTGKQFTSKLAEPSVR